ncbi:MAG: hypothetical protein QNK04_29285, partial [Myxococcota bacterium]|nr:hypothetical protein [Myxococcota bacterium]
HFNAKGQAVIQEVATDGKAPDKKLFLGDGGVVTAQCTLDQEGKKLNTRAVVEGGLVTEVLYDTTGNGVVDTREVWKGNEILRLEADTNEDRRPDVVQYYSGGAVKFQDEDVDFDGLVDHRFEGEQAVSVTNGTSVPDTRFDNLGCGSFSRFWWKR